MTRRFVAAALMIAVFTAANAIAQDSGTKTCDKPKTKCCSGDKAKTCCDKDKQPCDKSKCDKEKCDKTKCEQTCDKSKCAQACDKSKCDQTCDKHKQAAGCCSKDKQAAACCSKDQAKTAASSSCSKDGGACGETNCAGEQVAYKGMMIPRMVYLVGDQTLTCPRTAAAAAKESGTTLKYVVAGQTYDDKEAALAAHAEQLENFLNNDVLAVQYTVGKDCTRCSNSAKAMANKCGQPVKYRLASRNFASKDKAEEAAKVAREAAEKIALEIKVGNKCFNCPNEASQVAQKDGKQVDYCVGELRTTSKSAASVYVAIEKIKAAIAAAEQTGGEQIAGV